jgi:hypothetical protein
LAKAIYKGGVYFVDDVKELVAIFDRDRRLRPWRIPANWITHLKTNYQNAKGVKNLGYTVRKPFLIVKPKGDANPGFEALVNCEEGNLSVDEAKGAEYMPTPADIKAGAAAIRARHLADGVMRPAEFVGFRLQKTVQRPMISLA